MEPKVEADSLAEFIKVRPRLFGIAYRMLGSAAEAEDIVQDVWLRWQVTDRSVVLDPPAFLATTTTRLAINLAQSARSRHETYVGPWLPEPVDTSTDPQLGAERGEALEFAVLLLLEKLSPTERAAYVLREAFDYPYRQIAEILQLEEANTRQLVARARQHITEGRRAPVSSAEQRRLLEAFIAAAQKGELASTGRSVCLGCGLLLRRRWSGACRAHSHCRSRTCRQVHCSVRLTLLDRCDARVDPNKWTGLGTDLARWCYCYRRDDRRL